jgi:hypothetical protein
MSFWGPLCFGLVVGWVTYRTLRRKADGVGIADIASVVGAVGGATIIAVFKKEAFDSYCVGLAVGFFAYFVIGLVLGQNKDPNSAAARANTWMGEEQ